MTVFIGIDPGAKGAVASVNKSTALVFDLPHKVMNFRGLGERRIDLGELVRLLRVLIPADSDAVICIEQVGIQGSGVNAIQSVASLAGSVMLILGATDIIRKEPKMVAPQAWKKHYGLVKGEGEKTAAWKARSREMAQRLYPRTPEAWKLAKYDGRAEALLIAHYGMGKFG